MWARLGCGGTQSLQYTDELVYMFPQAPVGAVRWARCQPGQLSASVGSSVGAAGSVRVVVILRNSSQARVLVVRLCAPRVGRHERPGTAERRQPGKDNDFPGGPSPPGRPGAEGDGVVRYRLRRLPSRRAAPALCQSLPKCLETEGLPPGQRQGARRPRGVLLSLRRGDARQLLRTGKRRHTALLKRTNDRSTALAGRSYQSRENLHSLAFFKPERRVF